jgi:hypothetical protein
VSTSSSTNAETPAFRFDFIFDSSTASAKRNPSFVPATQKDVFQQLGLPVLANSWRGFNSTIFAYGQV